MDKQFFKNIIKNVAVSVLILGTAVVFASNWVGPSGSPPANNVPAPLNVGSLNQVKIGGLTINGLFNAGNGINLLGSFTATGGALLNTGGAANGLLVQSGNVGIGNTAPTHKLDVTGDVQATGDICTSTTGTTKCLSSTGGLETAIAYRYEYPDTVADPIVPFAGSPANAFVEINRPSRLNVGSPPYTVDPVYYSGNFQNTTTLDGLACNANAAEHWKLSGCWIRTSNYGGADARDYDIWSYSGPEGQGCVTNEFEGSSKGTILSIACIRLQ